ncbi:L-threonylcarbamoyladenylate synthase [Liquorilactobacillus mali]|uniref:Threonylcarbamoyl-AMP synthase n=1 Tax=Liquorilactobacillus mali KCTC 3596 = DSM 20444 TaxID=1046596 RepID=J1F283_9LACO|nr:L-threonylcarbamoyladenylate synthase [Liquorilactobacillus mali]EJE98815.1 Sua5/YciO/YrdC/YwlC family protein [Liquorilactobacillus mali KCTC 3596 = DSM 20444]KRN10997.1 Sua5 YciO YrdC YwlC family protein [Liquorilactobacillus mali KCTC 3596 = DSM 20444]MDC7952030.1 threonylcarbamoyl-AMP synthase [Liquorilactobacillus mali]MDV7757040.1 threonylcarbamoyl-AMP synthase [Liquorilactobacillus mali]QFQ74875.1 threonylcarbamoyl-AMP synthase [Liquorilactobacillus mali]
MLITKIYKPAEIKQAAGELNKGELIAFPTETVYGLGADATNELAVKRVYLAKGRPSDNPLIVTVSSTEMMEQFATDISEDAKKLIKNFWPGPLTLVFNIKPGTLSKTVTGGLKTAAFRMPQNEVTRRLIELAQVPIVGPSANSSGKPSPTTAEHVYHDLEGKIAGIVDDGPTQVGVESTIIDMSTDKPLILRPGAVTVEEIEAVLQKQLNTDQHKVGADETPKAPGMKYKHYAPDAQVLIVEEGKWDAALTWAKKQPVSIGIMVSNMQGKTIPENCELFDLGDDVKQASHNLFAGLRYFDDKKDIKWILATGFAEEGLGIAYMNRLKKSAGDQFFVD